MTSAMYDHTYIHTFIHVHTYIHTHTHTFPSRPQPTGAVHFSIGVLVIAFHLANVSLTASSPPVISSCSKWTSCHGVPLSLLSQPLIALVRCKPDSSSYVQLLALIAPPVNCPASGLPSSPSLSLPPSLPVVAGSSICCMEN